MATTIQNNFRVRRNFGKINKIAEIPNLIAIQKHSYDKFLQADVAAREARGHRPAGRLQVRLPDQGLQRDDLARVRELPPREAEVRRRRVPPARHDVLRADQGRRPPRRLGQGRGDRRAVDPRREGAGGLLRRDPADDGERDLHHQRDRARRRQPAPPLARAPSSTTTRARATRRASCSTTPASSRTAARGSTSSSTTRTSSTCASTAAGSCRPRCCSARSAPCPTRRRRTRSSSTAPPRRSSSTTTTPRRSGSRGKGKFEKDLEPRAARRASARRATSAIRSPSEVIVKKNRKFTESAIKKLVAAKMKSLPDRAGGGLHQGLRRGRRRRGDRRGHPRGERGGHRGEGRGAPQARHQRVQGPLHRQPERAAVAPRHAHAGQDRHARGGDHGDLPAPAPGRSADAGDGDEPLRQPVLQRRALRPLEGRPPQAELQVRHRGAARRTRSSRSATSSRSSASSSTSRTARRTRTSTTSTTSATAASARWASCSRTSTASASSAWSARSRSA